MRTAKTLVKRAAAALGLEIRRAGGDELGRHAQRQAILRELGFTLVLDVGANTGQYVATLRGWDGHYGGRIASFEPVQEAYAQLAAAAASDPLWSTFPYALSDTQRETLMHVPAGATNLSSLGAFTPAGRGLLGDTPVAAQPISTRRLDDVIGQIARPDDVIALKIDVQGHERQVLAGAAGTLARIAMIECEMPLIALYEGSHSFDALFAEFVRAGFGAVGMWSNYVTPQTGYAVDVDVYFVRAPLRAS